MSGLRDARLKKALDFAPDAQDLPASRTRQAINERAHQAIAPEPKPAWWRRLWSGAGTPSAPWNAAFATLALATLVTVMWQGREIPDAKPDSARVDLPAPTAPTPPPVVTDQPPATPAPRSAPATPARKAESAVVAKGPPPAQAPPAPAAAPPPAPPQAPAQPAPAAERERRTEAEAPALRDQDARALSKSESAAPRADAAGTASVARRVAPAAAAPAPATGLAGQFAPGPTLQGATQVRIESGSRSAEAPLAHPSRLADLIGQVGREARSTEALEAPVDLRVELRRESELVGVLELAGAQARWTQWRAGQAITTTARPDAAVLQALREELSRLPAR